MQTQRVPVAPGVELAADTWVPAAVAPGAVPFLLVHGLASNARMWDGVAARLTGRGHPAVTVDLRGHGARRNRTARTTWRRWPTTSLR